MRRPRRVVLCTPPALRVLPFLGDSPNDPHHARDGSGDWGSWVGNKRTVVVICWAAGAEGRGGGLPKEVQRLAHKPVRAQE